MRKILLSMFYCVAIVILGISSCSSYADTDIKNGAPAFPGAEGFGAASVGGRAGEVLYVTTLEDYDPQTESPIEGSLRKVLNNKGPRTIMFKVSGDIALKAPLRITEPYVTIAGQSSPGGICVRDCEFGVTTHDVVIRYMRFRCGDKMQSEYDSFNFTDSYNCILDHCSFSWAIDEVLSASEGTSFHNATFQWCIISEGLAQSYHPKGEHSMGSLLSGDGGVSIHHSLFANNANRNPRSHYLVLDFRNNVVYNWKSNICYTRAAPNYINMVANYFKPGPDTPKNNQTKAFSAGDDMVSIYLKDNVVHNRSDILTDNSMLVSFFDKATSDQKKSMIVDAEFEMPSIFTTSAADAFESVLKDAGATLPVRDVNDIRLIEGVVSGTGRIINAPSEVGGYPELATSASAPVDTDSDGMPDDWEQKYGFDPNNKSDGSKDFDGDGYTNLEEYLNRTDPVKKDSKGDFSVSRILEMGSAAVNRIKDKTQEYVEKQKREEEAKETLKKELMAKTKVQFSALPSNGEDQITLDVNGKCKIVLVRIPAGSFMMGADEGEKGEEIEYPRHKVNISKDFYMARTKVTTEQFCAVMGEKAKELNNNNRLKPANSTTWYEARDFCEIMTAATGFKFRMPTEAEWEYACRAGTTTTFNTGNTITSDQANFNAKEATEFNPAGQSRGMHTNVGIFAPNAWGLFDMHGNESEYCLDKAFRKYTADEITDPLCDDPLSKRYVMRAGKSASKAFYVRSAYRYSYTPDVGYSFRFVVEIPRK